MQVDLKEFRGAYLAEVDEHLAGVDAALLELERGIREGRTRPRVTGELMRLLHTIKGLSAMVGIEPIVTLAHHMETVLRTANARGGPLEARALEVLIVSARAIQARVRAVAQDEIVAPPQAALIAELEAVGVDSVAPRARPASIHPEIDAKLSAGEREQLADAAANGLQVILVNFAPSPARAGAGLTITSLRQKLTPHGEIVKIVPLAAPSSEAAPGGLIFALLVVTKLDGAALADAVGLERSAIQELASAVVAGAPAGQSPAGLTAGLEADLADGDAPDQRAGALRVDVARIDDAIEKLSALIVTRSRLARVVADLRAAGVSTRELELIAADAARQLKDLRGSILRVRMVPISAVLDRLPLVVRGLGKSTGKVVRLVLEGEGAELDKTVAERVFPALVHLLRNAVDHGVETPAERARAGKAEEATIAIRCRAAANRIEVIVQDDGRGVDRAALAAKARHDVPRDDAALLELLCRPGLSTRDTASTTSGRGIGMDVVKKVVVDQLGGELLMTTSPNIGTTFTLRLPLTIAIVEAFTLRCGSERFVVPVPAVEEILEIDPAALVSGPRTGAGAVRFYHRRGETLPVVDLARALGLSPPGTGAQALVVRRGHGAALAFTVDRVLGQQETVVRPLADGLVARAGIAGSTDLGDGRATLVLDLLGLAAKLGREEVAA